MARKKADRAYDALKYTSSGVISDYELRRKEVEEREAARRMWEWKQQQQMALNNIPLSNTGQVYTMQPQYTSGAMTFTQPTFEVQWVDQHGHLHPVAMPVSPVQAALPAAKEDPLKWLDRRVSEVTVLASL